MPRGRCVRACCDKCVLLFSSTSTLIVSPSKKMWHFQLFCIDSHEWVFNSLLHTTFDCALVARDVLTSVSLCVRACAPRCVFALPHNPSWPSRISKPSARRIICCKRKTNSLRCSWVQSRHGRSTLAREMLLAQQTVASASPESWRSGRDLRGEPPRAARHAMRWILKPLSPNMECRRQTMQKTLYWS